MINDQLVSQFTLLFKAVAPPLIRVTDSPTEGAAEPHWTPGDKLPATVLTNLLNGRFYVQVDNQALELNLPKNTQPGDQFELVYVGNSPRLTFTMATSPAMQFTPLSRQSVTADLSETAHLLGQLSKQGSSAAQVVRAQAPVLNAPPSTAGQLAKALAQALSGSGLFYEAHQAQWVQGERPLTHLLQEPQAQQGQAQPASQTQQGQVQQVSQAQQAPSQQVLQSLPGQSQQVLHALPETAQPLQVQMPPSEGAGPHANGIPAPASQMAPGALPAGMNPITADLVQQQLQILDTGTINWSGLAWPGQQMQWEISGPPDGQQEAGQQWQTRLNLAMPNLGMVSAWLLMGPQGLQVRLQADQEQARQLLAASGMTLDAAMQSAGLNMTHYSVETNG